MNAVLAGIFVTAAWTCLAVSSLKGRSLEGKSKMGLIFYGLGTFVWSLHGLTAGSTALMLISAAQTLAVVVCVVLL